MVEISEGWTESNGIKLYTKTWTPTDTIKATILFIHGLGEHCGRYNDMFSLFATNGIKVKSFDQQGFGQTVRLNGVHGHCDSIETTLQDIALMSKQTQIPAIPHFIMGQSMGGGLSLLFAHRNPQGLSGVIACSPLIHPGTSTMPSSVEYFFLGKVLPLIIPTFCMPGKLDLNNLSRDPEEVQKYKSDPLVHPWASIRLLSDIVLSAAKLLTTHYKSFKLPVMIAHGTKDAITCPKASQLFIEQCLSKDKTFKEFKGYYHELHNEPEKDLVIQEYLEWILARVD